MTAAISFPACDMTFNYHVGASPLLVSMPHIGTDLPDDIAGPNDR